MATEKITSIERRNPLSDIHIRFDNGGGIVIWDNTWAHSYDRGNPAEQAAQVVSILLHGGSTDGFAANDKGARAAIKIKERPDDVLYTLADIQWLLEDELIEESEGQMFVDDGRHAHGGHVSGAAEAEFFRHLLKLKYSQENEGRP